jgi:trans-2,3-dihydro-3-hydroxyanthranilate isomerase
VRVGDTIEIRSQIALYQTVNCQLSTKLLMSTLPFLILDVFASAKYTGNQLAVCFDAGDLTDRQMQQIAREINFSETTFVTDSQLVNGGYNTRIFTPTTEVPFAGHPTLGTAFAIQQELINSEIDSRFQPLCERVNLNYRVGQIPVDFNYVDGEPEMLWMYQQQPKFYAPVAAETLAEVIGIDLADIDRRLPIEPVSTGLPFIIIPLTNLAAASRAKLNLELYDRVVADLPAQAILIFCTETVDPQCQLHVRVFTECFGVPEDPATGSANGCLAAYLSKHQYFGSMTVDVTVEQGVEMGRDARLYLRARQNADGYSIGVGGRVVKIAKGEWML